MSWIEQELKDRKKLDVTPERAKILDATKAEVLPTIVQEAARGDKPVQPIRFQPVKSPGLFEAEFAKRDNDIIFHFWPWGLHEADRLGKPRPPFLTNFRSEMKTAMSKNFGEFIEIVEDRDMASFFVKARGYGSRQFWYDLAVKAVTDVHHALGGE